MNNLTLGILVGAGLIFAWWQINCIMREWWDLEIQIRNGSRGQDDLEEERDALDDTPGHDFLIKVGSRLPTHPKDEGCDAFIAPLQGALERPRGYVKKFNSHGHQIWDTRDMMPGGGVALIRDDYVVEVNCLNFPRLGVIMAEFLRAPTIEDLDSGITEEFFELPEAHQALVIRLANVEAPDRDKHQAMPGQSITRVIDVD